MRGYKFKACLQHIERSYLTWSLDQRLRPMAGVAIGFADEQNATRQLRIAGHTVGKLTAQLACNVRVTHKDGAEFVLLRTQGVSRGIDKRIVHTLFRCVQMVLVRFSDCLIIMLVTCSGCLRVPNHHQTFKVNLINRLIFWASYQNIIQPFSW